MLCQSLNPDLIMSSVICDFSFLHENETWFGGDNVIIYVSTGALSQPFSPVSGDGVCPGSDIEFTCVGNSLQASFTRWVITSDGGGDPTCIVPHNLPDEIQRCGPGGVFTSSFTGQTGLSYTSSLRAEDVPLSLNGTTVECMDGADLQTIGSANICIVGKP